MTVSRFVVGVSGGGGIICTIAGNKITFPAAYGGPSGGTYDTTNFVYNITKDEYKAITAITPSSDFDNAFSDVTVADIGTWVATDKFALARTQLINPTFNRIDNAFAGAGQADDDEIVVLDERDTTYGILLNLTLTTGSTFDAVVRGWSPQRKTISYTNGGLSVIHNANLKFENFSWFLTGAAGFGPSSLTTPNLSWELNRVNIIGSGSLGVSAEAANPSSGFKLTLNSCVIAARNSAVRCNSSNATIITHNCTLASHDWPARRLAGVFKTFNTQAIYLFASPNATILAQFNGTFDAASDFNASIDATAPSAGNSLINQTFAQLGLAWNNSPDGIDSQYPLDFRPKNAPGNNMKDNGNTFSDSPSFDFNGFKCPTGTGNQRTIGACNFSTNNGGVAWPGFGIDVPVNLGVAAPSIDFHLDERAPLNQQFTIARTARLPDIEIRLLKLGVPVDLTGAVVAFSMDDEFGNTKVNAAAGVVEDGPGGKVKYQWAAADVDTEGLFFGQFVITVSSKDYRIPNNTTQKLRIVIGPRVN